MGWVMVAMIIMVCAMKKFFFFQFRHQTGKRTGGFTYSYHTRADGMATMVCIIRKKRNFAFSS